MIIIFRIANRITNTWHGRYCTPLPVNLSPAYRYCLSIRNLSGKDLQTPKILENFWELLAIQIVTTNLRSGQIKIQSWRSVLILTVHLLTLVWALYTERKYLHFMGTRAEHLIVINIPAVGILLDLAKWEDSKYLVAIAPSRLSIAQNTRILSNVKLGILLEPFSYNNIFLVARIEGKSWQ